MTQLERTNISLITAGSIIVSAFGLGVVVTNKLNDINDSVNSVRNEMHVAIDSVKNKQDRRSYQSDLHFQRLESKLDNLMGKK